MVRAGLSLALLLGLGALAAPAAAQVIPDDPPAGGDEGEAGGEAELDEDPAPIGDDSGTEENPDAPRVIGGDEAVDGPRAPKPRATGYPVAEVLRPLTLPDFTSEIRLGVAAYVSPLDLESVLQARYGITRQAQVGVRYNIGGFYNDDKPHAGSAPKNVWNTGKAVAIDFSFLVTNWVAPRIAVPMYVDPFAIGIELGAPLKFRFGDKLALVGFEDVIAFKLQSNKFVPNLERESFNEAASTAVVLNKQLSDGYLRFDFGAIYQLKPNLSITGRFGVTLEDFGDNADTASNLRGQILFSPKSRIDLIGVMGFDRLDDASETFHVNGAIAIRI